MNSGVVYLHRSSMIQVTDLEKSYGKQCLFGGATFTIAPGERIGLIGRNGHGKTTLFRILIGEESADGGEVIIPKNYHIGHLSQHLRFSAPTVLEEACRGMTAGDEGWVESYRAEAILFGLGFGAGELEQDPRRLSGGFQVRLNLAKVLLADPNLLLLDEPTNYLDIVSLRWLERSLRSWPRELMLITHDRSFMDAVTTHTMQIHRARIRKVAGSTETIALQILQEEEVYERTRLNEAKRRESAERFIERFRAQATRARAVQSRVKQLEKRVQLEKLAEIETLDLSFRAALFPGRWLLTASELEFGFEAPLIAGLNLAIGRGDRIGVIGRNGRGKTTLLNLLAGELRPDSGTLARSPNLEIGYFGQTNVERLTTHRTVEEEILAAHPEHSRAQARNICGAMMFEGDAALKPIGVLSGGERSRVLLGKILVAPANLLLLDEPTNHLDMESVDSLVEALAQFSGAVVIVTHSEMILRALVTRLIVFDLGSVAVFEGTYDHFLARQGWSEEASPPSSERVAGKNRRELRQQRAQESLRRRTLLDPLKKRMDETEAEIVRLEAIATACTQKLIELDPTLDPAAFTELSREHHAATSAIEKLFAELETLNNECVRLEQELNEG